MPFSDGDYDAETLALMTHAFEEAWDELGATALFGHPADGQGPVCKMLALHIMGAVKRGERDPRHLRLTALSAIQRPKPNNDA